MSTEQHLQIKLVAIKNPLNPGLDREEIVDYVKASSLSDLISEICPPQYEYIVSVNGNIIELSDRPAFFLKPNDKVVIQGYVGGGGGDSSMVWKTIGMLAITVLAFATGNFVAGTALLKGGAVWGLGSVLASAAVMAVGSILINTIFPVEAPDQKGAAKTNTWNPVNTQQQGIPYQIVYGSYRSYGNVIAANLSQQEQTKSYINAIISMGMGPYHEIYDIKLNNQPDPLSKYKNINIQTRDGYLNQPPISVGTFADGTRTEYNPGSLVLMDSPVTFDLPIGISNYDKIEIVISFDNGLYYNHSDGDTDKKTTAYSIEIKNLTTGGPWIHIVREPVTIGVITENWIKYATVGDNYDGYTREILETSPTKPIGKLNGHTNGIYWEWEKSGKSVVNVETYRNFTIVTKYKTQPFFMVYSTDLLEPGQYSVRVTKIGADEAELKSYELVETYQHESGAATYEIQQVDYNYSHFGNGDMVQGESNGSNMFSLATVRTVEISPLSYPREALVGISALATDQISGGFSLSALVDGRIIRVYNGTSWEIKWSSNPAWVCWDILTQPVFDNGTTSDQISANVYWYDKVLSVIRYDGFDPDDLDLAAFYEWAEHCDEAIPGATHRLEFHGIFSEEMSVWDAAVKVASVGRATLVQNGTIISVVVDKASSPVALITMGNMIEGSFVESFISDQDKANEIEVTYNDAAQDYERNIINIFDPDATIVKKASIDLFGVTLSQQAWRAARLELYRNKYINRAIEFDMAIDAIAFTLGDVVNVQHDVPQWGDGGRIVSATTTKITLDKAVVLNGSYVVMVRFSDDTIVTKNVLETSGTYSVITVTVAFSSAPTQFDLWAIGVSGTSIKPFRVNGVSKSGDLLIHVNAVEYNESIYNVDTETAVIPTPNYSNLRQGYAVDNLNVKERAYFTESYNINVDLLIDFDFPYESSATGFVAYYQLSKLKEWVSLGKVGYNFRINNVTPGLAYIIAVCSIDNLSREMPISSSTKTVHAVSAAPVVDTSSFTYMATGVTGITSDFSTCDCIVSWDWFTDEYLPPLWFGKFKVVIKDNADNVLSTSYTTNPSFTLTKQDNRNLLGGPYSELKFYVTVIDVFGVESLVAIEEIPIHTPPEAPTGLNGLGIVDGIVVDWVNNNDQSLSIPTHVYASDTDDRSLATLVGTTYDNAYTIPVSGAATKYVWVKAVDDIGSESTWEPLSDVAGVAVTSITGVSGVYGYITSNAALNWVRDVDQTTFVPAGTTVDLTVVFKENGAVAAQDKVRVTRNADGNITSVVLSTDHTGDANISKISFTKTTLPTRSCLITFTYTDGTNTASIGETVSVTLSGASGYTGASGYSGYTGYSGRTGFSGYTGYSGLTGFSGYTGYSGLTGFSGYTGFSGLTGFSGYTGFSGLTGYSGYTGYSGLTGFSGYSGLTGFSGYTGFAGKRGGSNFAFEEDVDASITVNGAALFCAQVIANTTNTTHMGQWIGTLSTSVAAITDLLITAVTGGTLKTGMLCALVYNAAGDFGIRRYIGVDRTVSTGVAAGDFGAVITSSTSYADTLKAAFVEAGLAVINKSEDDYIRQNDVVTITDASKNIAGTRIYTGTDRNISNYADISSTDFSSLVVMVVDGSMVVKGTLSAETLAANSTITNTLNVGSSLILNTGGAFHTPNKTSFADTDEGFFLDTAGNFVLGDADSYFSYNASTNTLQLVGDIIIGTYADGTTTVEAKRSVGELKVYYHTHEVVSLGVNPGTIGTGSTVSRDFMIAVDGASNSISKDGVISFGNYVGLYAEAVATTGGVGDLFGLLDYATTTTYGVVGIATDNTGTTGVGVFGQGADYGVVGKGITGVTGEGTLFGVRGYATSDTYAGLIAALYGDATYGDNITEGGTSQGVYATGLSHGGTLTAAGTSGTTYGVIGDATANTTGTGIGVYGLSKLTAVKGVVTSPKTGSQCNVVVGEISGSNTAANVGGYFTAANSSSGGSYGVIADGYTVGVQGTAQAVSGTTFGVYGDASANTGGTGVGVNGAGYTRGGNFDGGANGDGAHCYTTKTSGIGLYGESSGASGIGVQGSGTAYDFYAVGTVSTNFGPFTGAHDAFIPTTDQPEQGDILIITSMLYKGNLSSTLPRVTGSNGANSSAAYGVYVLDIDTNKNAINQNNLSTFEGFMFEFVKLELPTCIKNHIMDIVNDQNFTIVRDKLIQVLSNNRWIAVNAIGEGQINVVSEGGNISIGDYIVTSSTIGKGMKQADDIFRNKTVAKACESVSWTAAEIAAGVVKQIACTYHCG